MGMLQLINPYCLASHTTLVSYNFSKNSSITHKMMKQPPSKRLSSFFHKGIRIRAVGTIQGSETDTNSESDEEPPAVNFAFVSVS